MSRFIGAWLAAAAVLGDPGLVARAQEGDVQAAAQAFEQAQEAQLGGDYARAAELFELADRLVPSPQALRSALRNHRAAGHDARAATLAIIAFRRPGSSRETRELAEETLAELEPQLGRLLVHCQPACGLLLDGQAVMPDPQPDYEVFVQPGDREIRATWDADREHVETLAATAGERYELRFEAPRPEPEPVVEPEPEPEPEPVAPPPPRPQVDTGGHGMTPIVFATAAGVTALLGGLYFWSLADTLKLRDNYEADPTEARYNHGVDARRRTITLGSLALVFAAGTAAVGLFGTDWGGRTERTARLRPVPFAGPGGGGLMLSGSFGARGTGRP